jgi:metal-responsive CopG/Arc/MetJ family transcriptional regulator
MSVKPVQISIDDELLRRIDRDPEAKRLGRSAFVRTALRTYLAAKERKSIDEQIRRAYAGQADELLDEVEQLLPGQAWPAK